MDLMEAIVTRRSVRAYTEEPVDRATIEYLIGAATKAPSAMNLQPWAFGVIEGAEKLRRYSDQVKEGLLAQIDQHPALARFRDRLTDPAFNVFHGAPVLVLIYARPGAADRAGDCCLAAQNLMLAARGMNLGTCWIGFSHGFFETPQMRAELGVPDGYQLVAPIVVGHPAVYPDPTPRDAPRMLFWK